MQNTNQTLRYLSLASLITIGLVGCGSGGSSTPQSPPPPAPNPTARQVPLLGEYISRATFANPHAHIPAQCFIETGGGTQNACLFCHTNGVAALKLGNNNPQAGLNPNIGNLQAEYAFGVFDYPQVVNSSINPWINTLKPEVLHTAVAALGANAADWDMQTYIRQNNWQAAFAKRAALGALTSWDAGVDSPFRLFPGLNPDDLPAKADGFVRTNNPAGSLFQDEQGFMTGWRAVNFMPYGIFTPLAGSVSGIYIRLPKVFMQTANGAFSTATYVENLDRVAANIQNRLTSEQTHYVGAASNIEIVRGQYPLGTEFAHPLHYVDVQADGSNPAISPFPGTRAHRVKEVRWMIKLHEWYPAEFGNALKEESAPVYASRTDGWIENGTGWIIGGFIEDAKGELRPQTPSELTQCVGCHSSNVRQSDVGQNSVFTSGTGNTIDSTWALPRKLNGNAGWGEMNYLGFKANSNASANQTPGTLTMPEPVNRYAQQGEFRFFMDHVVGISLYGDMPATVDAFLAQKISTAQGYSQDWPDLNAAIASKNVVAIGQAQRQRLALIREFTAKGAYLDSAKRILPELFLPTRADALEAARRYREVVVTQRFDFGKDVFDKTPASLQYFRDEANAYTHQNGTPYVVGEMVTDRPINTTVGDFTYGVGIVPTLIDENKPFSAGGTFVPDYVPLLAPD
ncbi:MAG: hypothetical protein IE913_05110 [Halothiobacillus sp.]|nr:hypothetical protein [Halothiobacillus sp.]